MKCPKCLDIELCDDCEMHACPLCCPNIDCPHNFAYDEVHKESPKK